MSDSYLIDENRLMDLRLLKKLEMPVFHFEMTDTFGNELNYSWVKRFSIEAKSLKSAQIKLSKEVGFNFQFDGAKYKAKKACIAYFLIDYEIDNNWMEKVIKL